MNMCFRNDCSLFKFKKVNYKLTGGGYLLSNKPVFFHSVKIIE